jgi:hypothetical protein
MSGKFSDGNLGDFTSDSRIELVAPEDFYAAYGDPGYCNDGSTVIYTRAIKVTFTSEIKLGMHINFGDNTSKQSASKYYAENPNTWPPEPWTDGPSSAEFPFSSSGVDMTNCVTINPSMLNTDNSDTLFYIDYYTYPY